MAGGTCLKTYKYKLQIACKRLIKDHQAFNQLLRPNCFIALGFTCPVACECGLLGSAHPCRSQARSHPVEVAGLAARAGFGRAEGPVGSGWSSVEPAVCPQQSHVEWPLIEGTW